MIQKMFRKLIPSQILAGLSMALCSQIDAMLISLFLNVDAVSAYGFFIPMTMIFVLFAGLFSNGISAVCAKHFGIGDKERINANYSTSLICAGVISVILCALCFFAAEPLAVFCGAKPDSEIAQMFREYCRVYALSIPFYILLQILTSYLYLVGKRSLIIISVTIVTVSDVLLDVLSGIFHWGMFGFTLATVISQILGLLPVAVFFFRRNAPISFKLKSFRLSELRETTVNGMPFAIDQCSFAALTYCANLLLNKYSGPDAVAALAVVSTLTALAFSVTGSVGNSVRILSGIFYGEESREMLVKVIRIGLTISVIMGCVLTLLCEVFAVPLAGFYLNGSPNAVKLAVLNLRLQAISFPLTASTYLLRSFYQSTGRNGISQVMSAMSAGILPLLFAFTTAPLFSVFAVWMMIPVAQLLSLLIHFSIALIYRKKLDLSAYTLAMLRPDFGFSEDAVLGKSIKTYEDAAEASRQTAEFCKAHGQSPSFSYYSALYVEELTVFLLKQHENESSSNEIFFRIAAKDDKWILQFRDGYKCFDFAEYIKLHHSDDTISHLGIRIVSRTAKDITYINAINYNNIILRLR